MTTERRESILQNTVTRVYCRQLTSFARFTLGQCAQLLNIGHLPGETAVHAENLVVDQTENRHLIEHVELQIGG